MMTEKDIKIMIESIEDRIRKGVTREEALGDFVGAGILDWNGDFTPPYKEMLAEAGIEV